MRCANLAIVISAGVGLSRVVVARTFNVGSVTNVRKNFASVKTKIETRFDAAVDISSDNIMSRMSCGCASRLELEKTQTICSQLTLS